MKKFVMQKFFTLHYMEYTDAIMRISANIKRFRLEEGMTVQDLAYKCEIERSNLSRIEAGKNNLTVKTMVKICTALNISLKDIIDF